ncbi:MAG: dicarboxylate/amino acid:cation symporter [Pseudomonadales bacterium]|jgi:Na+/H+-dicarboxylate symporter|nr:dicarboxylate/amino acid:cation symporter [Pseudomonadales bacterium]
MNLTSRILIGMGTGLLLGAFLQWLSLPDDHFISTYFTFGLIDAGGDLFITLLKMMVVPLVLVSLTCGAASLGATGKVGRLGGKTIGLYLITTAAAVTLALSLALIINPGLSASDQGVAEATGFVADEAPSIKDTLVNIIPSNPITAMAEGKMLQVIAFAVLLGLAMSKTGEAGARVLAVFNDLNSIIMKLVTMLIQLAPYGVFCLMVTLGVTVGLNEITKLLAYFLTVVLALLLHMTLVYPALLRFLAGLNPITYLKKMREPMLVAFSSSSSGATLPVTLRTVEKRVGVSNNVASFAVPLGATINMDGTAIMQGVATVFIAQFYGYALGPEQLLMVILTATLASIGTAAVPGVGLIMLAMVLGQVGLPLEGIGLIIGVDRLLDMMRTAVNVTGDGAVATIVAKSEGELDLDVFHDPEAGWVVEPDPH